MKENYKDEINWMHTLAKEIINAEIKKLIEDRDCMDATGYKTSQRDQVGITAMYDLLSDLFDRYPKTWQAGLEANRTLCSWSGCNGIYPA